MHKCYAMQFLETKGKTQKPKNKEQRSQREKQQSTRTKKAKIHQGHRITPIT